jgi:1,4-dihydroxy-2-naphthoate polyprenyltransferase
MLNRVTRETDCGTGTPAPPRPDTAPPRVLVVLGHPRPGSFCEALADAYATGAIEAGAEVRRLWLADLQFELNVLEPSPRQQETEGSVATAMSLVSWADHLVFVFPTWWGTMPALLKGFLDRLLMPGFAFEDRDDGEGWHKLLTGKSAHLLTTMDTPPFVYRWIYGSPGLNGLARATLGFCGVQPVRRTIFGPVKDSSLEQRQRWLAEARAAGQSLRDGVLSRSQRLLQRLFAWLAAIRLQFHPMVWGAYGLGAATAMLATGAFQPTLFWLGLACLFTLEVATVFTNEIFDWESDRRNTHAGPFTGGSRVLVEGRLTPGQLGLGAVAALLLSGGFAWGLPDPPTESLAVLAVLAVLAIGYTAPPLKLCWRGVGELNVAATHSVLVVLFGHTLQGAALDDPLPWLLSLPLFLSVLPAITLSGVPDHDADRGAGKRTLVVLLGPAHAVRMVQGTALLAASAALLLYLYSPYSTHFAMLSLVAMPHAVLLVARLQRYLGQARPPGRIDGLMALALLYIVWFVLLPLLSLVRASPEA